MMELSDLERIKRSVVEFPIIEQAFSWMEITSGRKTLSGNDEQEFSAKKAAEARRVAFLNRKRENERLAAIENEPYKHKVYITFDHYGEMTPLGDRRGKSPLLL